MIKIKHFYLFIFLILYFGQSGFCQSRYSPQLKITTGASDIAKYGFVEYITANTNVTDATFSLTGDGYFEFPSKFDHQFAKDPKGFVTKTFFNQRYKRNGPIIKSKATGTTGTGTVTNNRISMPGGVDSRVGKSWSPSPKIENYFLLIFENTSNIVDSGCITFYYHDTELSLNFGGILDYGWVKYKSKGVSTGSSLYNQEIKWEYKNLQPGEQRVIYIPMTSLKTAGTKLNLGSQYSSGCSGNSDIKNNSHTSRGHPHDPNIKSADKICMRPYLQDKNTITYTIRFQNEGNAPAVNVLLKDIIDPLLLDISTLDFIESEYPYSYSTTGNLLEIEFANINLPGLKQNGPKKYTYDETESYIKFKICTYSNLNPGVIENQAEIIFDTQPSIFTNVSEIPINYECQYGIEPCESVSISPLKITQTEEIINLDISIVPNPIINEFFVQGLEGQEASISIFNNQGKLVHFEAKVNKENNKIEASDLANGLYFVQIRNEFLNITKKVIKI